MKKIINRGFTLIELLVVIAIIGILASIVLVSLNSARNKGKDTRVISDVNQARTQIETEAGPGGAYSLGAAPLCLSATPNTLNTTGTGNCKVLNDDAVTQGGSAPGLLVKTWPASGTPTSYNAYAVYATLPGGTIYCADSLGKTGVAVPTTFTSATLGGC